MIFFALGYLLLTLVIGIISARKKKNSNSSFHGAGLGILLCVAAGAGEWMGGTSTTGVSESGFLYGISGAWYTIANGLGIMVCALLFAKLYRSLHTHTVSGIVGFYFGPKSRFVASILLIFIMAVVGISQMIAVGSLGSVLFGIDVSISIVIFGIIIICYTVFGGMTAVGSTNIMHLIVLYLGMGVAVLILLLNKDIYHNFASLPSSYFSLLSIGGPKIGSWILASVLGACTAQAGIQPILAAKDDKTAVKSSIIIAFIVAPFGLLTALLGMIAKANIPDIANGKLALPLLVGSLPPVVSGLLIAAMMAAILSTASPIFLACGTLFSKDVLPVLLKKPEAQDSNEVNGNEKNEKKELIFGKCVTALAGIVCTALAIFFFNMSEVLNIVYFAYSLRGSLFVIILFGIYSKKHKFSEASCIVAMVVTAITGLFWVIFKTITGSYPIATWFSDTYAVIIVAIVCMLLALIVEKSITTRKTDKLVG